MNGERSTRKAEEAPVAAGRAPWFVRIARGFADIFGIGPRAPADPRSPADAGTRLALVRSYLASERTLMGWIRTALSMISFGFTIGKLGQTFESVEVKGLLRGIRLVSVESIAYFLVILGTFALLVATLQHVLRVFDFRGMGLARQPGRLPVGVALLLVTVGAFALSSLVLRL